jgi:hemerythrin-like domain-containing protein
MRPSEVRRTILEDHGWLRALLADVDEVARRVLAGDAGLGARLRERGEALHGRFLRHLALEEQQLVPALRDADEWGEERAARLEIEHAAQRAQLERLLAELRDASRTGREVAVALHELVSDLVDDMDHEERTLLDERVLHDDPVATDVETG